ncbi:fimbrial protein [Klebsiella aerogenes]|uniref:fimbrial protein n=1 Tax=Klebsiella aerogenes TaxID=548 RepID=UPI002E318EC9|nr:fimbrial protein [Klebsiella aerogenes]MED7793088.1 fimbrial protein [Klebsiella aerogenes]
MHISPIAIAPLLMLSFLANAGEQGHGTVRMNGEILDAACNVDTESRDQTINMLTQPVSEIISEQYGLDRPFTIRLVNCVLKRHSSNALPVNDWQYFQITFDGIHEGNAFGVEGGAKGVSLQIRDVNGHIAVPGQALPSEDIEPGSMKLNYNLRLIGNGSEIQPGSYHSTIRYKLDYY